MPSVYSVERHLRGIYARQGVTLPISTLSDWVGQCGVQLRPLVDALKPELMRYDALHADETALQELKPRKDKASSHRAYLWVYASARYDDLKAVIYDLTVGHSGQYSRTFLGDWRGKMICDDYAGYKACFTQGCCTTEVALFAPRYQAIPEPASWPGSAPRTQGFWIMHGRPKSLSNQTMGFQLTTETTSSRLFVPSQQRFGPILPS